MGNMLRGMTIEDEGNKKKDSKYESGYEGGNPYEVIYAVPSIPVLLRCPHCHATAQSTIQSEEVTQISWVLGCLPRCGSADFYYHFCGACGEPVARVADDDFVPGDENFNRQIKDLGPEEEEEEEGFEVEDAGERSSMETVVRSSSMS